jgi:hypothetical protein
MAQITVIKVFVIACYKIVSYGHLMIFLLLFYTETISRNKFHIFYFLSGKFAFELLYYYVGSRLGLVLVKLLLLILYQYNSSTSFFDTSSVIFATNKSTKNSEDNTEIYVYGIT